MTYCVAPYVGAWIETARWLLSLLNFKSHPMWVRGLKLVTMRLRLSQTNVAPYVGAWIETLIIMHVSPTLSRTLCGCVD